MRRLAGHPGCDALGAEAAHVLQPRAAHGEIADNVPEEGGELENRRDEGEEGVVELQRRVSALFLVDMVCAFVHGILDRMGSS